MIYVREWCAFLVFCAGIGGVVTLFSEGASGSTLILTIFLFLAAYVIWPSKRKGQRDDDGTAIADIFEFLIEFPVDIFLWIFRLVGRLFSGKGDGLDIDL